jgi:hypothetical protein
MKSPSRLTFFKENELIKLFQIKRINFNAQIDPTFPVRGGIANSDILKSYLGLLCLGSSGS